MGRDRLPEARTRDPLSVQLLLLLFSVTLALSATLLFSVQPLVAKSLLPFLGGTPAIWNTCMLFFQAVLLAGYAYAHVADKVLGRLTWLVHGGLLLLSGGLLPLSVVPSSGATDPWDSGPAVWLLTRLTMSIGLPVLVLSATTPLLQKWFSGTQHRSAKDPYFLYAASNAGSLSGLLAYPLLLEATLPLREQAWLWSALYVLVALLLILCMGFRATSWRKTPEPRAAGGGATVVSAVARVSWNQRGFWMFAAFVPSSLMLGATQYLTTDIGSVPLLWIGSLGLYLISFILAFGRSRLVPRRWLVRWLPLGVVALALQMCTGSTDPPGLIVVMHLAFLFGAALLCHGRLADSRPEPEQLTDFYLCVALGGVCGGMLNALVAPMVFTSIAEYPLAMVLVCLLRNHEVSPGVAPRRKQPHRMREHAEPRNRLGAWLWAGAAAGVGLLTLVMGKVVTVAGVQSPQMQAALVFALPIVFCYLLAQRPVWFALAAGGVFLGSTTFPGPHGRTIHGERDFFGVLRVTLDPAGDSYRLVHGHTLHGRQFLDPKRSLEPIAYYHRAGPAGDIFRVVGAQGHANRVGVVGLGAGVLMAYARPDERWTCYEIDPAAVRIASNPRYFTYLSRSAAGPPEILLGDARLRLRTARDGSYDLIVLDAFSSDAIPVHLLTREAVELYLAKLAPGGLLACHISSRYYRLEPVLGALAEALGLAGWSRRDVHITQADRLDGRAGSHWVVLGRNRAAMMAFEQDRRWQPIETRPDLKAWTDDFSSPLQALGW